MIENTFPTIKYSSFLYRDHLVWSGLEQEDMRVLYECLGNFLTPALNDVKKKNMKYLNSSEFKNFSSLRYLLFLFEISIEFQMVLL